MEVTFGNTRQDYYTSGTYDGLIINTNLLHTTNNTAIAANDFLPENVMVKVSLERNGNKYMILHDNLLILGLYSNLKKSLTSFTDGINKTYQATSVKNNKLRSAFISFGHPIRLSGSDRLVVEVGSSNNVVSANINTNSSRMDFYLNPCIGYSEGIPMTTSSVIQHNSNNQSVDLGSSVQRVTFLNLDKTNYTVPVVSNLDLTSDKLSLSLSTDRLIAYRYQQRLEEYQKRFGATPPTQSVFELEDAYPQSLDIFNCSDMNKRLNQVRLSMLFDGAQVAASKNFIVWTKLLITKESAADAIQREEKHIIENISSLPSEQK